jgi:hydroxymethylglutaryl-CoA reductase
LWVAAQVADYKSFKPIDFELADHLVENVVGIMSIPVGVATNVIVDGTERLVAMATEESSVVAAVCNTAKQCRDTGGQ